MKQILLATTNKAKIEELRLGTKELEKNGYEIITLADLNIKIEPEETGKTFKENAQLKAQFYGDLTHIPAIADDGGLMIDILDGEPGVKSKRWLGRDATDEELIVHTLNELKNVPIDKRSASLQTCLCFYNPQTKKLLFEEEKIKGHIATEPSGRPTHGYPFRALFVVEQFGKYYDELTDEEHIQVNHRLHALERLTKEILQSIH